MHGMQLARLAVKISGLRCDLRVRDPVYDALALVRPLRRAMLAIMCDTLLILTLSRRSGGAAARDDYWRQG
jgi:hypothetical protein